MTDTDRFPDPRPSNLAQIPTRWAEPDASSLSKLPKPTSRDAQKGRCDECGGWHGLPAVHLSYMGHADVTLALIDIDPLWTWEPLRHADGTPNIQEIGGRLVMWGTVTVCGKTLLGVGTAPKSKDDPEKELIGDLIRNVAMRFGIATKLWSKADAHDATLSGDEPRGRSRSSNSSGTSGGNSSTVCTEAQRRTIAASFKPLEITEAVDKIAYINRVIAPASVASSTELTKAQASAVIDAQKAEREQRAERAEVDQTEQVPA